ncbi:MFS transporter [Streptomyces sp. ODS28]|uniref:MFS transporter n=1 Tax=Streptomyces sp. ODS28 TaxID=3136688 RepID=UPI0031F0BC86
MSARVLLLAFAAFVINTGMFLLNGLLPVISERTGSTVSGAGQLVTLQAVAYAVSAPVLTALAGRRMTRRAMLSTALLCYTAGSLVSGLAMDYPLLAAARVLTAVSTGLFTPTAIAAVADMAPAARKGRAVGVVAAGVTLSTAVGTPAGLALQEVLGFGGLFAAVGGITLLTWAAVTGALPSGQAPAAAGQDSAPRSGSFLRTLPTPLRDHGIRWMLLVSLLTSVADYTAYAYVVPLLHGTGVGDPGTVTSLLLAYGVAAVVGSQLSALACDRWGAARPVAVSLVLIAAGLALLPLAGGSAGALFCLMAVWGLGGWGFVPAIQHYLVTRATSATAVAVSLNTAAMHFGMAGGGALGGATLAFAPTAALGPLAAALALLTLLPLARAAGFRVRGRSGRTTVAAGGTGTPKPDRAPEPELTAAH